MSKSVTIVKEICKGCELCVKFCPKSVLILDKTVVNSKGYNPSKILDLDKCISCGICSMVCPESAIKVEK